MSGSVRPPVCDPHLAQVDAPRLLDRVVQRERVLVARRGSAACRRCRTAAARARAPSARATTSAGSRRANAAISLAALSHVVELDHLDRRVHVAQRDRDEARRDAAARDVDRVGVGARARAPTPTACTGCSSASAASISSSLTTGWSVGPALDDRAGAEVVLAELLLGDARARRSRASRRRRSRCPGRRLCAVVTRAAERRLLLRRPRRRRRRRARRRPRRPGARPRRRRSSRGGCPSSARRRGRSAARPARRRSPRRRRRARARARRRRRRRRCRCAAPSAPGAFVRSSALMRWIGFLPTTPGTVPPRVASSTRWPISTCGSQPPTPVKRRKPPSSMCVTISPISSMWPTTATVAPPAVPGTRAVELPMTSPRTSSVNARGRLAEGRGRGGLVAGRAGRGQQGAAGRAGSTWRLTLPRGASGGRGAASAGPRRPSAPPGRRRARSTRP